MMRKKICILDYGVGNYNSVKNAFLGLDFPCFITSDLNHLSSSDLIILPGVGSFPAAMSALHSLGLVEFLRDIAHSGHPMLGLCLGMQLFADESLENGVTSGLSLIPGKVVPLGGGDFHIGWNTIKVVGNDCLLLPSDGNHFYFNHSLEFKTSIEYQLCVSNVSHPCVTGVRHKNVVGLQFHPEKSQDCGRVLLKHVVKKLTNG